MDKTVCELFAGVGGFRLGLERTGAGWNTVWFSQWEPGRKNQWAHDCYVHHWGDIDNQTGLDIALVDKNTIPNHSLLVGGFPCQNYSVAASKSSKGIEGEKGVLWWQIRDVLIAKRPPFVLLENVDRLLRSPASQRGRDFGIMLTCFAQLGYRVEWRVVNAADYGAAQRRRRIFIFAYRDDTAYSEHISEVEDFLPSEVVNERGFFANVFPIESSSEEKSGNVPLTYLADIDRNELLQQGNMYGDADLLWMTRNYRFDFENAGYMVDGEVYTCRIEPLTEQPIVLRDIVVADADDKYYIEDDKMDKWTYLKGAKRIERIAKNGHKYMFSEGAIAFPDPLDKPSRTMLTSESSVNRSTHVIEDPYTNRLRLLSPIETERLQGFDDDWTNTGMPEKFRYFCMGNALVVPMITRMGNYLNKIIEAED